MSVDTPPDVERSDGQSEASDCPPAVTGSMDAGVTCEPAVAGSTPPVAGSTPHCDPFLKGAIFGLLAATAAAWAEPTVGVSWSNFQEERWKTDEAAMRTALEAAGDLEEAAWTMHRVLQSSEFGAGAGGDAARSELETRRRAIYRQLAER